MPRISLLEARAVKDVIPPDGFRLILGNVPGVGAGGDILRDLTVKCQQASIPGFGNEFFPAIMGGFQLNFRGRKIYPHTLSVTYVETSDYATTRIFRQWHEIIVNHISGYSPQKSGGYALDDVRLEIYNQNSPEPIDSIRFFGFFLQDMPDTPLDATNTGGPMLVSPTFYYDYFEGAGISSSTAG